MEERRVSVPPVAGGPCGEARSQAEASCSEAVRLKAVAQEAAVALRDARRDLAVCRLELEEAQAAGDATEVALSKQRARSAYQDAIHRSLDGGDRQRTAGTWLSEIDRINRASRQAVSRILRLQAVAVNLQAQVEQAEQLADARRIRAEAATRACVEARERVAACEERQMLKAGAAAAQVAATAQTPVGIPVESAPARQTDAPELVAVPVDPGDPNATVPILAPSSMSTSATSGSGEMPAAERRPIGPLVVERLLEGDRAILRALARDLSELTGHAASLFLLVLQDFVDAVTLAAADECILLFDTSDPFWGQFSRSEARSFVRALSGLGFRYDPRDGWYGGRVPTLSDVSMALAYVGYDVRGLRHMPTTSNELRELPDTMQVAPVEFLRRGAPKLTVDQVMTSLGSRAENLGDLWDDWGRLRPLLLTEAAPAFVA